MKGQTMSCKVANERDSIVLPTGTRITVHGMCSDGQQNPLQVLSGPEKNSFFIIFPKGVSKYSLKVDNRSGSRDIGFDARIQDEMHSFVFKKQSAVMIEKWNKSGKELQFHESGEEIVFKPVVGKKQDKVMTERRDLPADLTRITVNIRELTGHFFPVNCHKSFEVNRLKNLIRYTNGLSVDQQRLVYNRKELAAGMRLLDYDVSDGDTIFLMDKTNCGGSVAQKYLWYNFAKDEEYEVNPFTLILMSDPCLKITCHK
jgi:hypothetical protein